MNTIILLIIMLLNVYIWLVIAGVVVSWLVVFDVLNIRNKWVYRLVELLNRATRPVMDQLRRVIPSLGGIDLSPMIVIFGIYILQGFLYSLIG